MDLRLDFSRAEGYKSQSQVARVVTEEWFARNMYCPICGAPTLRHDKPGSPVSDFLCDECHADYELKSINRNSNGLPHKVPDGAYGTMIERITSLNNPHFFFLTHTGQRVSNLVLVPNYVFVPNVIEARRPLRPTARRAGWTGCNILLDDIPSSARVPIVRNGLLESKQSVLAQYARVRLLQKKSLESRGWQFDVLNCVERISASVFTLDEVYAFAESLQLIHPTNNNVKPKIRQQLQILRDKGFLEFLKPGVYRKIVGSR